MICNDKRFFEINHRILLFKLNSLTYNYYLCRVNLTEINSQNHEAQPARHIQFKSFHIKFQYYTKSFTEFEIAYRIAIIIITFIVLCLYCNNIQQFPLLIWNYEQKWILFLLAMQIIDANPLYELKFIYHHHFIAILDQLSHQLFLFSMGMFWLTLLHSFMNDDRRFITFYFPKLLLATFMFLVIFLLQEQNLKSYHKSFSSINMYTSSLSSWRATILLIILVITSIIIYVTWIFILTIINIRYARNFKYTNKRVKWAIGTFSIFSLNIIIYLLFHYEYFVQSLIGFTLPTFYFESCVQFLFPRASTNFLVILLVYIYSPCKTPKAKEYLREEICMDPLEWTKNQLDQMYPLVREDDDDDETSIVTKLCDDSDKEYDFGKNN
ncbi:hypothetical protein SNEBB_004243 [Seison nebaliae]|nr:hypothetical protein SNEBB_004243 [Seison nebaliae]